MSQATHSRRRKAPEPADDSAILIRRHYRQIGVIPGWNAARFKRLCATINVTPNELGAMAALTRREVSTMLKCDKFSPPASLQFALIEAATREARLGIPQAEIVPFSKLYGR